MALDPSCPTKSDIDRMLTGRLSPTQISELAKHLSQCSDCASRFEDQARALVSAHPVHDSEPTARTVDNELLQAIEKLKAAGTQTIESEQTATVGQSQSGECERIDLSFLPPSDRDDSLGRLGNYEITEVVGQGGMGLVLKGLDPKLNRFAAIKVLLPQWGNNGGAKRRFMREARAAAAVSHDHVVTIHAVDETDGMPFLVMEYIAGKSLDERIKRDGALKLEEILRIGMQVAAGLSAAHAQGLVHRDIKPGNILLENGVERVKITDFGLARVMDDTQITQEGVVAGTPEFMSPEQVDGATVDHRSDLFSLGSVLYCMCTGRSPFRGTSVAHAMRRVHVDTPRPISEVNPEIPDSLVEIVDRLLEKSPHQRIQSADDVVAMLGSHLVHVQQPNLTPKPARLPKQSNSAVNGRWFVPMATTAILLIAAVIAIPAVNGSRWGSATALPEREKPSTGVVERSKLPVPSPGTGILYYKSVDLGEVSVKLIGQNRTLILPRGKSSLTIPTGVYEVVIRNNVKNEVMRRGRIEIGDQEFREISFYHPNLRPLPPLRPAQASLTGFRGSVRTAQLSRDESRLLTTVWGDEPAIVWEHADDGWRVHSRPPVASHICSLSPDGSQIAVGDEQGRVFITEVESGAIVQTMDQYGAQVRRIQHGPDGNLLVSADSLGYLSIWILGADSKTWVLKQKIDAHSKDIFAMAITSDSKILATGSRDRKVKLWDLESSDCKQIGESLIGHTGAIQHLAFSPDDQVLATSGTDAMVMTWNARSGKRLAQYCCSNGWYAPPIAFADGGRNLVIGSGHALSIWDWQNNLLIDRFHADWAGINGITFAAQGKKLLLASESKAVTVWDYETRGRSPQELGPQPKVVFNRWCSAFGGCIPHGSFSSQGHLAVGAYDQGVSVWNLNDLQELYRPNTRPRVLELAFNAQDQLLIVGTEKNWFNSGMLPTLTTWQDDQLIRRVDMEFHPTTKPLPINSCAALVHRFLKNNYTSAHIVDTSSGEKVQVFPESAGEHSDIAYSAEHDLIAIATWNGTITLWRPSVGETYELACPPLVHGEEAIPTVAFSEAAPLMVTAGKDRVVKIWDISDPTSPVVKSVIEGFTTSITEADFSPDGAYLALVGGQWDYTITNHDAETRIWDITSETTVASWESHTEGVYTCGFSPDSKWLFTGSKDCRLKVWDVGDLIKMQPTRSSE